MWEKIKELKADQTQKVISKGDMHGGGYYYETQDYRVEVTEDGAQWFKWVITTNERRRP